MIHAPQSGLNPVGDSLRKGIGPLVHGLIGHTDRLSGGWDGPPQQFDGVCFEHAALNHSSDRTATIVLAGRNTLRGVKLAPVGEYKDRFDTAMKLSGKDVHAIAKDLGVTYQAIKKILAGNTKMPRADHSAIAAQAMNVDPVWLATGQGIARGAHVWPLSQALLAAAVAANAETQRQLENVARATLGMPTLPAQAPSEVSTGQNAA